MPNVIYLKSDKSFRGPYTDDPPLLPGETKVTLTAPQFAAWDAVARPDPLGRIILFDAGQTPCFFYGTLDQCAEVAPTLRWALMYVFAKISTATKRARLRPMHAAMARIFDDNGENGGIAVTELQAMIGNVDVKDDAELAALKAKMLSLTQWNL